MPTMFALSDKVIGNPQVALFAAFGSIAMLLLVDFGGPMAERLQAQAALIVAGGVFICLATLASQNAWLAAVAMAVVAFGVIFAGVVSSVLAGATTSLLLAFILPVSLAAPASAVPERLAGLGASRRRRASCRGAPKGTRVIAALGVAAVIWGWGVAQYPVLLPGTGVTLTDAGATQATYVAVTVVAIAAVILVVPSFALLYVLQGRRVLGGGASLSRRARVAAFQAPGPPGHTTSFRQAARPDNYKDLS